MKALIGGALFVAGGAMIIASAMGGFLAGVAIMIWSQEEKTSTSYSAMARRKKEREKDEEVKS